MNTQRKITKYQFCDHHAPWFSTCTRYRKIECMVEGGPGGWEPGCKNGKCRIWPGTDMFDPAYCSDELDLDWTVSIRGLETVA